MGARYTYVRHGHEVSVQYRSLLSACVEALDDQDEGFCSLVSVGGEGKNFKHTWEIREYIEEHNQSALLRTAYRSNDPDEVRRLLTELARVLEVDLEGETQ